MLVPRLRPAAIFLAPLLTVLALTCGCDAIVEANKRDAAEKEYNKGLVAVSKDKVDEAVQHFTEAIRIRDDYDEAYLARALIHREEKRHDSAIKDLTEAIRLKPGDAKLFLSRGTTYMLASDYDSAISNFSSAIHLDPKSGEAYFRRSMVYFMKGEIDKGMIDAFESSELGYKHK